MEMFKVFAKKTQILFATTFTTLNDIGFNLGYVRFRFVWSKYQLLNKKLLKRSVCN